MQRKIKLKKMKDHKNPNLKPKTKQKSQKDSKLKVNKMPQKINNLISKAYIYKKEKITKFQNISIKSKCQKKKLK